jgi:acetyl-CoA carboxylase carboxyltransferase component
MGGDQAAKVLQQIEVSRLKNSGEPVEEESQEQLLKQIKARYEEQTQPEYAASRIWIDAIIDPEDTRTWISIGIEAANASPAEKPFRPGVLQT